MFSIGNLLADLLSAVFPFSKNYGMIQKKMDAKGESCMGELSKLPNIGAEVERQLNAVGITTYDELKADGCYNALSLIHI